MRVHICGARGSTPAPGADYVRYGGHTSCVAIAHDDATDPALVLDGGTGLQVLSESMEGRPFRGSVLLGHLHWDHTHGLPFFGAGALPGARVQVLLPDQREDAEAVLALAFSPPHFPVRPSDLGPGWSFAGLEPGVHEIEGFEVVALEIPHKGGRTFGFRVSDGRSSLAYLSDHAPLSVGPGPDGLGEYHPAALQLCNGVDVVLHDAQNTAAEFPGVAYLGHAAVEYAVGLGVAAGARSVVLFHHGPRRTDEQVDEIVASQTGAPLPVSAAAEGDRLLLGGAVPPVPARSPSPEEMLAVRPDGA